MKLTKKIFYLIVCLTLVTALTVPAFASYMVIDTVDVVRGDGTKGGSGYLSSYTGRSYAETSSIIPGTPYDDDDPYYDEAQNWVSVELFIDGDSIDAYVRNAGSQYSTAWVSENVSGTVVQGAHYIYRSGTTYRGVSEVNP